MIARGRVFSCYSYSRYLCAHDEREVWRRRFVFFRGLCLFLASYGEESFLKENVREVDRFSVSFSHRSFPYRPAMPAVVRVVLEHCRGGALSISRTRSFVVEGRVRAARFVLSLRR